MIVSDKDYTCRCMHVQSMHPNQGKCTTDNCKCRLYIMRLYLPNEVARMFRVNVRTVPRWIEKGYLDDAVLRIVSGRDRRYIADEIDKLLTIGGG